MNATYVVPAAGLCWRTSVCHNWLLHRRKLQRPPLVTSAAVMFSYVVVSSTVVSLPTAPTSYGPHDSRLG